MRRGPVPGEAWEHFEHGADIGVRGRGATREAAFAQAARALAGVITDPRSIREARTVAFRCEAAEDELLLVDFLNQLVLLMATEGMLFGRAEVSAGEDGDLRVRAFGEPVDVARHRPAVEVKGATLTALRVAREPDGTWCAQCVVDV